MANSGSKTVNFCSRKGAYRFQLKWSWSVTSQDITNNKSTVNVKCYLISLGNGYSISSSTTKAGTLRVNGVDKNFSFNASVGSGGTKKIHDANYTINHESDGTGGLTLWLQVNLSGISISGSGLSTVTITSTSYTLPTIARRSTLTSGASWKFPNNSTISISRKSSALRSTVRIYIAGQSSPLKTWTKTNSTSFSTNFTDNENKAILQAINSNDKKNITCRIELDTMNGDNQVGSTHSINGTISYYGKSATTLTTSLNIGGSISGKITENHSSYRHTLDLLQSNGTTSILSIVTTAGETLSWSATPTASTIYALCPNAKYYNAKLRLRTYYKTTGVQVGTDTVYTIKFNVTNSNPTYSGTITYDDLNTTTRNLMDASGQTLVQSQSSVRVTISGNPVAKNSATMKTIQATLAGRTISKNYSSSASSYVFDFGAVNASSNQSCTIKAIDSRGNSVTLSKVLKFLPYTKPSIGGTVGRLNRFSKTVEIKLNGTYANLNGKNSINSSTRAIAIDDANYGSATDITVTSSAGRFNMSTASTFQLDETSIAKVKIVVKDKLNNTVERVFDVGTGLPIIYFDVNSGNIAINSLPNEDLTNVFNINSKIDLAKNQFFGGTTANISYGINAMNSDIVGLNSIVFNDVCNNLGEGLRFPDTGYATPNSNHINASNSPAYSAFTTVYWRDKGLYVDNSKILQMTNPSASSREYEITGKRFTFQTDYDVGADKAEERGFVIRHSTEGTLQFDVNEIVSMDKDYKYKYIGLAGSQIGLYASQGMRLQYGTDVGRDSGNWSGLTIEGGTFADDGTFTSNNNVMHIDGNEILAVNNSSQYAEMYIRASTLHLYGHQDGGDTNNQLEIGYDNMDNPAYVKSYSLYNRTTTSSANMYVTANGVFSRSTSSAKAKLDIVDAFNSLEDNKKLLDMPIRKWFDKTACEVNADVMTAEMNGEKYDFQDVFNLNRIYGVVAEELIENGLGFLVEMDNENKEIMGVSYDRIGCLLIPLIKDLYVQVEELKAQLDNK